MAKIPAIYQTYADEAFRTATWSASAGALSSYALTTLNSLNPASRVRWGVNTVTLTAILSAAVIGDVFVLPMHNLDAGASVLTLTNGAGLSQAVTIPTLQANGLPPTIVVDLTGIASGTRTSNTWRLVIAGNSANVTLGGAILLYQSKKTFLNQMAGDNFAWSYHERETHHKNDLPNEYGTRYLLDYRTATRSIDVAVRVNSTGLTSIRNWFRANHGGALPGFFWPDPNVSDGYFGTWQDEFDVEHLTDSYKPLSFTFTEFSKGQPLV